MLRVIDYIKTFFRLRRARLDMKDMDNALEYVRRRTAWVDLPGFQTPPISKGWGNGDMGWAAPPIPPSNE